MKVYEEFAAQHGFLNDPRLDIVEIMKINAAILRAFQVHKDDEFTRQALPLLKLAMPNDKCDWIFKKRTDTARVQLLFVPVEGSKAFVARAKPQPKPRPKAEPKGRVRATFCFKLYNVVG